MKTILLCCLCLVAGVFFGYLIPKSDNGELDGEIAGKKSSFADFRGVSRTRDRSDMDTPEGKGDRILKSDADLTELSPDDKRLFVPASLIRGLSKGSQTRRLGQELFSKNGEVEKALKIRDREKAVIQAAWRAAGKQVRDLESRSSKFEDLDDGSVRITVPDIGAAMSTLGETFQSSVRAALGENRADVFLSIKGADQVFSPPPGERAYQVSVESVGNGRLRYHMTLEDPSGRRVWVSESIPNEIRHLTDAARILPKMENEPEPSCE